MRPGVSTKLTRFPPKLIPFFTDSQAQLCYSGQQEEHSMTHILVVDDDPAALALLDIALQHHGYQPLLAQDGAEALALLETQPIDLILSDVAMPRLNGYQLCQTVKTSPAPQRALIPFIFISGRSLASDIRFGKALGADDYLTKPFILEDLLAVIRGRLETAARLRTAFNQTTSSNQADAAITITLAGRQLRLDRELSQAWLDGEPIPLTAKEARLLTALAQRPGWVVSDVELVKATHGLAQGDKQQARRKSVRAIIAYLRRKLAAHLDDVECIKTVRGRGYMLVLS
jgi:DNA-binding response OmpR family regulator